MFSSISSKAEPVLGLYKFSVRLHKWIYWRQHLSTSFIYNIWFAILYIEGSKIIKQNAGVIGHERCREFYYWSGAVWILLILHFLCLLWDLCFRSILLFRTYWTLRPLALGQSKLVIILMLLNKDQEAKIMKYRVMLADVLIWLSFKVSVKPKLRSIIWYHAIEL